MPSSLAGMLSLLAPCFTQPTFQTFNAMVVGFVGRIRDCTVTGMLQAAGLAGGWPHSRAHDFFARRRWNPDDLGLALLDFLVVTFLKPAAPIRLAVDDTLFGRSGRRVWGAHYLHDGAQPEGSGRRTRWGNCWVVVVLIVELPCLGGRPVGLPILFRLFRPKDDQHHERRSQAELARELIDMVLARFPTRIIELVMDGAYATKAWRGLPDHVTVTTRMRANAAVFALAPPRTGKRGRPALKGARLASLAKLAAAAVFEPITITGPDGRSRVEHVWSTTCLWYGPFHTRPVVIMLIRKPDRSEGFDVAIASTDTAATSAELIARYDSRWTIENRPPRGQGARRRPSAQPRPESRRADRPVRLPRADDHDRLLRAARRPRRRPPSAPPHRPVVPPEADRQLHRHARRATPRTDPPRILGTSTRRDQHTTNHTRPVTTSARHGLKRRKSRVPTGGAPNRSRGVRP